MQGRLPEEIERANRMFAVENAVKIGYVEGQPAPIEHAREIFNFLQENTEIPDPQTGFQLN